MLLTFLVTCIQSSVDIIYNTSFHTVEHFPASRRPFLELFLTSPKKFPNSQEKFAKVLVISPNNIGWANEDSQKCNLNGRNASRGLRYTFLCQGTSTRRQRRDLFSLRVKLPPVGIEAIPLSALPQANLLAYLHTDPFKC